MFIRCYCLLSATCLFLSVWGLTPFLAVSSQSFKDLPGCHNKCFPQIFASNWQLSHLVSCRRQVTSQWTFGQLSIVHSQSDGQKEEGQTDHTKRISPSKSSAGDNKIWKSITKICVRTESLSVYYVYLKVTRAITLFPVGAVQPNELSSYASSYSCKMTIKSEYPLPRYASGQKTPKQYHPRKISAGDN